MRMRRSGRSGMKRFRFSTSSTPLLHRLWGIGHRIWGISKGGVGMPCWCPGMGVGSDGADMRLMWVWAVGSGQWALGGGHTALCSLRSLLSLHFLQSTTHSALSALYSLCPPSITSLHIQQPDSGRTGIKCMGQMGYRVWDRGYWE